jgi:hypothetical protein
MVLEALPFRIKNTGVQPMVEASVRPPHAQGQILTVTFIQGTAEFFAVTQLMESWFALARRVEGIEKERDDANDEIAKLRQTLAHKDKQIAGYEATISGQKRERKHQ